MGKFSKSLTSFRVKSIAEADRVRRAITIELLSSVILDTPVDIGHARANWQTSTGAPKTDVIESTNGERAVEEARTVVSASRKDATIYMTNNVPYIGVLEHGGYPNPPKRGSWNKEKKKWEIKSKGGYSWQAPAGMVGKNMARIWANIRNHLR